MFYLKLIVKLRSKIISYFLARIAGKKTFIIKPNNIKYPITLRTKSSDLLVFKSIIMRNTYDVKFNNPQVIIDCGANIGLTTIYWKNKFPNALIIAIEPDKGNYNILLENIKYYKNIIGINKGIWHKDCFLEICNPNSSNWAFKVTESKEETDIRSITLNEIIENYKIHQIDILKIDIEGAEKYIFNKDSYKWLNKVNKLIIEIHDKTSPGSAKAVFETVSNYDFSFSFHEGNYIFDLEKQKR